MGLNLNFSLIPPTPGSENAGVQVVNSQGVPIGASGQTAGQAIAAQLGWSTTDVMEDAAAAQIDAIVALYGNVNIAIHVSGGANGDPTQIQFDNIDPLNPAPPIDLTYLTLSQENNGIKGVMKENAPEDVSATDSATKPTTKHVNMWLQGNVYVAFLEAFMEMMRILKESKAAEGGIEIKMMQATVEMAKVEARTIMKIAEEQRMNYIVGAVFAGISCGISAVSLGMTSVNLARMVRPDPPVGQAPNTTEVKPRMEPNTSDPQTNAQNAADYNARRTVYENAERPSAFGGTYTLAGCGRNIQFWGSLAAFGQSLNQMATNATQAATAIPIAQQEGYKTMVQTYRQMLQHIMEKATEKFKQDTDQIAQLINTLDSIRQKLAEAVAAALRKSA